MIDFIRGILNPAGYHGRLFASPFFEGWYFKLVDRTEGWKFAIIPGIYRSPEDGKTHAFVQVLDGAQGKAYYHVFGENEFEASASGFELRVGENRFSAGRMALDLQAEGLSLRGELEFSDPAPSAWPVSLISPGIMGWYAWVPWMECYHGVVSLDHGLAGALEVNGVGVDFRGGRGYIEKDWGKSFPSAWVWFQSNHFSREGVCLTASIANIPWMGSAFTGFIAGLWLNGRLEKFTTYGGARVDWLEVDEQAVRWRLSKRGAALEMKASRAKGDLLRAPTPAGMDRRIAETLDGMVEIKFYRAGKLVFEDIGRNAGLEVVGKLPGVG